MVGKEFKQMKVITVIGARPQFIKAAVASKALGEGHSGADFAHRAALLTAICLMNFLTSYVFSKPAFNLGIGGRSHGQNTGRMIEGIEKFLIEEKPDWLLVDGDTDSTLAMTN